MAVVIVTPCEHDHAMSGVIASEFVGEQPHVFTPLPFEQAEGKLSSLSLLELARLVCSNLPAPPANRFVGDDDPTFGEQLFYFPKLTQN